MADGRTEGRTGGRLRLRFPQVLLPTLSFSERDAALWEEDPREFVRKEYDMIEDFYSPRFYSPRFYSPRSAATNLLMAVTKARPKDCLQGILLTCSQVLEGALNATDEATLRQKDGALLAVGSLHDRLAKKDVYRYISPTHK